MKYARKALSLIIRSAARPRLHCRCRRPPGPPAPPRSAAASADGRLSAASEHESSSVAVHAVRAEQPPIPAARGAAPSPRGHVVAHADAAREHVTHRMIVGPARWRPPPASPPPTCDPASSARARPSRKRYARLSPTCAITMRSPSTSAATIVVPMPAQLRVVAPGLVHLAVGEPHGRPPAGWRRPTAWDRTGNGQVSSLLAAVARTNSTTASTASARGHLAGLVAAHAVRDDEQPQR